MSTEVEKAVIFGKKVRSVEDAFKKRQKPPGEIPGICPLLESRRFLYAIPNEAFELQAAFDVVLAHQIPRFEGDTYGNDSKIVMTDNVRRRVEEETPRAIIVSAGARALDHLRSNGMDLGHICTFIRQAPWRMPVAHVNGADFHLLILRSGDITGSEDLRQALVAGKCKVQWDAESRQHVYVDPDGKAWDPQVPWRGDDY